LLDNFRKKFLKVIPFNLTNGQKNAIIEIEQHLTSGESMNRLIQGVTFLN
jgi:RecG-like helicase